MILQRLVEHYDRLAAGKASNLPTFGFSRENVDFCLVVHSASDLPLVQDLREPTERGKLRARMMELPHHGEKRTANDRPYFLSDGSDYLLGSSGEAPSTRDLRRFRLFREQHLALENAISHPSYSLFCRFLERWDPAWCKELDYWQDGLASGRIVVRTRSDQFLHEIESCRRAWVDHLAATLGEPGPTLVAGEAASVARVHKSIKGVHDPGGQAEKSIVSFNKDKTAFDSFGKQQGANAPVSVLDAFKYTTALNALLADRRFQLGDATVVFWAGRHTPEEAFLSDLFTDAPPLPDDAPAEDKQRAAQVRTFLSQLREGYADSPALRNDERTPFYILALSPNGPRLSVRFWLDTTLGQLKLRLARHLADTALSDQYQGDVPPIMKRLVASTGRAEVDRKSGRFTGYDTESVSPSLAGSLANAVLTGGPYPETWVSAVLRRLKADRHFSQERLTAVRGYLTRNLRSDAPMALNPNHPSPAYHCGRLLCLLDYIQGQAVGNVNAGLVKKFYTVASTQPTAVFGRLVALTTKAHLPKLNREESPGFGEFCERHLRQIMGRIGDEFPVLLTLKGQGEFALGFYQQMDDLPAAPPRYPVKTERGESVKSKSEALLANMLASMGVEYIYELPLAVPGHRPIKPDFTVRGESPRETVYIEYLGMMDKEAYRDRQQKRFDHYRSVGILPEAEGGGPAGMLVTFSETKESGIDTEAIRSKLVQLFGTGGKK